MCVCSVFFFIYSLVAFCSLLRPTTSLSLSVAPHYLDSQATPSSVLLPAPGCATLQVKAVSLSTLSV